MGIIPEPQSATLFEAAFTIQSNTTLVIGENANAAEGYTVIYLKNRIADLSGLEVKTAAQGPQTKWSNVVYLGRLHQNQIPPQITQELDISEITKIGEEGYYLHASDSLVVILANSSPGLFYGAISLVQLIHNRNASFQIPGITIYDWPAFEVRGVLDDFSSGPSPNPDYFKDILRFLSQHKMNTYMLGIGNRFAFENHPRIREGRSVLSQTDLAELQAYAEKHHIQIIPVIETLVMPQWLRLPEYIDLAEFPGATSIAPLRERTYALLDELIHEIAQAFNGPFLHIKGTASHQVGWYASKDDVERYGLSYVLAEHFNRVIQIARKYDKQVIMDAQLPLVYPMMLNLLPDDIVFVDTRAEAFQPAPGARTRAFADRTYFVSAILAQGGDIFPQYNRTLLSTVKTFKSGVGDGANGAIIATRNRSDGFAFHEYRKYGLAFAAECAWSPSSHELSWFNTKYFRQFFGTSAIESEVIYGLLIDLANLTSWQDVWRHPRFVGHRSLPELHDKTYFLATKMPQVLQLIDSLAQKDIQNKEHLDYLRFAALVGDWLSRKIETAIELRQFRTNSAANPADGRARQILDSCFELIEDLDEIQEALQLLWIRHYGMEDLAAVMELFGTQIDYWQEAMEQIQTGEIVRNWDLTSQWIYAPYFDGDSAAQEISHAFFRKTFEVAPGFRKAYLQAMGDTHLKVYLNGGFIGEVIHSQADSLNGASKVWDITSTVQPGKNVLAVEAWRYRSNSPAGLNIFGQIEYEFGRRVVIESDAYWKTSLKEEPNWRNLGFFDVQWLNAVPLEKNLSFIPPNFKIGRPSKSQMLY